ncbi:uncharacterized protein LOC142525023 isoform X2 [Primulina tabacum]|uniref:uncharacterized protein LOC142525023 isoform X2 n=1 Tax=Primulina tabacum TaxID=48773 RepID=UPI003F5AD372
MRLLVLFGITVARRTGCSLLAKYSSVAFHLLALLLAESKQGDENIHGLYVMKLMRSFCISSSEKRGDPFKHMASILVNILQKNAGRKLLLDPKRGLSKKIIRQIGSSSSLGKKGAYLFLFLFP